MASPSTYKAGQLVELNDGRSARIRFVGSTAFAAGDWIGVELDQATGKNDGSVQGQRYFDCDPEYGMFLRSTGIKKVLQNPAPKAKAAAPAKKTVAGRPSAVNGSTTKTAAVSDPMARRRETMNAASPSPVPRSTATAASKTASSLSSRTAATTNSAASRLSSTTARKPAAPTSTTATRTSTSTRQSLAGTHSRTSSATAASTAATRTARTSTAAAASPATRERRSGTTTSISARPTSIQSTRPSRVSSVTKPNGDAKRASVISTASSLRATSARQQTPVETEEDDSSAADTDEHGQNGTAKAEGDEDDESDDDTSDESSELEESPEEEQPPTKATPARANGTNTRPATTRQPPSTVKPTTASRTAAASKPAASSPAASNRVVSDLEAKLRVLEKRREEDRDRLKSLERLQTEKDRLESIIKKLQDKYQPQQQELSDLRKRIKEQEEKVEQQEKTLADHDEEMEMATLDREMAEETAEGLRTELEALQLRLEELQLEAEYLREENSELNTDMSPEERKGQNWLQMERANERLREALIRLRDMTQDNEAELKSRIDTLEADMKELDGIKDEYETAKEKLKQSDVIIEDLRQQLETASGAEEMLEELTGQNMSLTERIEDLRATIEDLEALKELNDELEINHVEAEKQMQEELDYKDSILAETARYATQQNEKLTDHEYTIAKFRELVNNLQSHIQEMQASQQITEAEAEELSARSKAMTDLNKRLQTSANKSQVNVLDLELRRFEAQEAIEHLAIIQMFLPEGFEAERKAVSAYLKFRRIASKSRLLHAALRDKVLGNAPVQAHENVFAICDILDKLVWMAAMCDRFVNNIRSCPAERFLQFQGALSELEPVERSINGYMEMQKRGELRTNDVSEELQRLTALLAHLAEVHIPEDSIEAFADDVIMRTLLIQSNLENTAAALSLTRSFIPVDESEADGNGELDGLTRFQQKTDAMVGQLRSAKVVVGKSIHALEELRARCMALRHDLAEPFEQCQHTTSRLAISARQLGEHMQKAIDGDLDESDSVRGIFRSALSAFCVTVLGDSSTSDPIALLLPKVNIVTTQVSSLLAIASDLSKSIEFERLSPPWMVRADQVKNTKLTSLRAEDEVRRLREEIEGHLGQLRSRNQALEEQAVKIELLENRTRDATAKANRITELQRIIESAKMREKELTNIVEQQTQEHTSLLIERDRWKAAADERRPSIRENEDSEPQEIAVASSLELDALKLEVEGLQGALRYMSGRAESSVSQSITLSNNLWLQQPLSKRVTPQHIHQARSVEQAHGLLNDLMGLVLEAHPVSLSTLPENKLAWRPAKQQSRWQALSEREKWQSWKSHRDRVIGHANAI